MYLPGLPQGRVMALMIQNGTLASAAYERLRGDIIGGLFKPGEKVLIRAL